MQQERHKRWRQHKRQCLPSLSWCNQDNSICIYKYIYTHSIFQQSIDIHFQAPIPNITHTNSWRPEQHNHNRTPTTMMPQQYTSCRGDCTVQTQPLSPHGHRNCSGESAFTVVIFSAGPQCHKLGSQSIPFCQHLLTLQSLLHSPFLPIISSPSSVSSPGPLLPWEDFARLSLGANSTSSSTNACNQEYERM